MSASLVEGFRELRKEFSVSCKVELARRRSRLELFGTSTGFSLSEEEDVYRSLRVAFRGLDRVARVSFGGAKMVGSFGLGLRRRAIIAVRF